mmetsp:Transcript_5237/g.13303  ORF Transcript_5237/g.13303 Transcript_5237/m.13303 type:complete len:88 (+) Transcript_5237:619-882(+)
MCTYSKGISASSTTACPPPPHNMSSSSWASILHRPLQYLEVSLLSPPLASPFHGQPCYLKPAQQLQMSTLSERPLTHRRGSLAPSAT